MPNIKGNAVEGEEEEEDTYDVVHGQELASDILLSQEKSLVSLRVRSHTGTLTWSTCAPSCGTGCAPTCGR